MNEGEFARGEVILELSNYLQEESLKLGPNILGLTVNNVRGSRVKKATLLAPTGLTIDARSPYLLTLGVFADEDPWMVGKQSIVEATVESQRGCDLKNVTVNITPVAGVSFEKLPAEPLGPVSYEGRPIQVRFGLTSNGIGPLEAKVTARAGDQD